MTRKAKPAKVSLYDFAQNRRQLQQMEYETNKTMAEFSKIERKMNDKKERLAEKKKTFHKELRYLKHQHSFIIATVKEMEEVVYLKDNHGWNGSVKLDKRMKGSARRAVGHMASDSHIPIK